jgi:hypothetical protein
MFDLLLPMLYLLGMDLPSLGELHKHQQSLALASHADFNSSLTLVNL